MLGTWWGARSPSAACIGGRRLVPEIAGVVRVERVPRAGRQTSTHHVVRGRENGEDADGLGNVD